MKIRGKYDKDRNFTYVYSDNKLYTIARNSGDWGSLAVGERSAIGPIFCQEDYDRMEAECKYEGEFELKMKFEIGVKEWQKGSGWSYYAPIDNIQHESIPTEEELVEWYSEWIDEYHIVVCRDEEGEEVAETDFAEADSE